MTDAAAPYFEYFGAAAGQPGEGWYSYEAGDWHVIVLNSVCLTGPAFCTLGEQQMAWLRADVAATSAACVLAYWHTPRYSSGSEFGDSPAVQPFWDVLGAEGADVVLNGDDHHYERFAPLDAAGERATNGMRQFIVGTGGAGLRALGPINPRSDFQIVDVHGVLRLTLKPTDYQWAFVAEPDGRVLDEGTAACA